ncbi:hypothetical protein QE320_gp013 [Pseudomonas phage EM]|uniref:Uncharacterized protein n=1 Tax=Pseudomonas phage EM TaxID=2936914 RepID=A0AAE9HF81_9CAUD|nr:hypothetical protein QE320_gp013 [Pseudomonas phage EM]UPW35815.1 hypothetical protein EM_013 [Pseudomonas phage EM]
MKTRKVKFFTRVKNEEESRAVQSYLLKHKIGFDPENPDSSIRNTDCPILIWQGIDPDDFTKVRNGRANLTWSSEKFWVPSEEAKLHYDVVQEIVFEFEKVCQVVQTGPGERFTEEVKRTLNGKYSVEDLENIIKAMKEERK